MRTLWGNPVIVMQNKVVNPLSRTKPGHAHGEKTGVVRVCVKISSAWAVDEHYQKLGAGSAGNISEVSMCCSFLPTWSWTVSGLVYVKRSYGDWKSPSAAVPLTDIACNSPEIESVFCGGKFYSMMEINKIKIWQALIRFISGLARSRRSGPTRSWVWWASSRFPITNHSSHTIMTNPAKCTAVAGTCHCYLIMMTLPGHAGQTAFSSI